MTADHASAQDTAVLTKVRVLLVEDDPDVRYLVRSAFENDGRFDVIGEARDGFEAVWLAGVLEPDAIVLDLMMPRMDGREALGKIRETTNPKAIVILSALQSSQCEVGTWLSADAFVRKIDFASAPEVVASLCSSGARRET
jgi:CheY-like chemotaxis protein